MGYIEEIHNKIKNHHFKPMLFLDMEFGHVHIKKEMEFNKIKSYGDNFIFEIAYLYISPENIFSIDKFIKPRYRKFIHWEMNERMKSLLGFTEEKVNNEGVNFMTFHKQFKKAYKPNETLIGVWGKEDIRLWKLYCQKLRLPYVIKDSDIVDVSDLLHTVYDLDKGKMVGLEKSFEILDIQTDNPLENHNPIDDCYMTFLIFQHIINNKNLTEYEQYKI